MASISGKDTKPEVLVRSYLFKEGLRFRKNDKTLPGKPDIVLPKYQIIIFINGCFWHGHSKCTKSNLPTSNAVFWKAKIGNNIKRDMLINKQLREAGWKVIIIWECNLKNRVIFMKSMSKLIKQIKFAPR